MTRCSARPRFVRAIHRSAGGQARPQARKPLLRAGGSGPGVRQHRPAGAPRRWDHGRAEGAHAGCLRRRRQLRGAARQGLRDGGHGRVQHVEDGPGARPRRRPCHRLHREDFADGTRKYDVILDLPETPRSHACAAHSRPPARPLSPEGRRAAPGPAASAGSSGHWPCPGSPPAADLLAVREGSEDLEYLSGSSTPEPSPRPSTVPTRCNRLRKRYALLRRRQCPREDRRHSLSVGGSQPRVAPCFTCERSKPCHSQHLRAPSCSVNQPAISLRRPSLIGGPRCCYWSSFPSSASLPLSEASLCRGTAGNRGGCCRLRDAVPGGIAALLAVVVLDAVIAAALSRCSPP